MLIFPAKGSIRPVRLYPEPTRAAFKAEVDFQDAHAAWAARPEGWRAVELGVEMLGRAAVVGAQYAFNAILAEEAELIKARERAPLSLIERQTAMAHAFVAKCVRWIRPVTVGGIALDSGLDPEQLAQLCEDAGLLLPVYFSAMVAQEVSPEDRSFPSSGGVG